MENLASYAENSVSMLHPRRSRFIHATLHPLHSLFTRALHPQIFAERYSSATPADEIENRKE
jgi:hypothetical protein